MTGKELFGYLFAVVGALGLVLSGLCTVSFGGIALMGFIGTGGREAGDYLGAVLIMGVPAMIVFWIMVTVGRRLLGRHGGGESPRPDTRGPDDQDPWLS